MKGLEMRNRVRDRSEELWQPEGPAHVALGQFVLGSKLVAAPTFFSWFQSLLPSHSFSVLQFPASNRSCLFGFLININMY